MCRNNVADECARSTYGSDLATGCTERSYGRDVQDFYQNRKYSKQQKHIIYVYVIKNTNYH